MAHQKSRAGTTATMILLAGSSTASADPGATQIAPGLGAAFGDVCGQNHVAHLEGFGIRISADHDKDQRDAAEAGQEE